MVRRLALLLTACQLGTTKDEPGGDTLVDTEDTVPMGDSDPPVACADRSATRNLYWGDLHVHTAYSFDAWGVGASRHTPADAYAYARGEAVDLPYPSRLEAELQLPTPLDFAAVTDHAEFLGELALCTRPDADVYWSATCIAWRIDPEAQFRPWSAGLLVDPTRRPPICESTDCLAEAAEVWERTRRATEEANDPCTFTSLHGYEWTGSTPLGLAIHRNLIFADDRTPDIPISAFEASSPTDMLTQLSSSCAGDGCRFISIPHNANLSRGAMFPEGMDEDEGRLRREHEPLVEMTQVKGVGECDPALTRWGSLEDEACDFGLRSSVCRPQDTPCGDDAAPGCVDCLPECGPGETGACIHVTDHLRGALKLGLERAQDWGFNPLEVGIIGSTDTHNGMPGDTTARTYGGHHGRIEANLRGLVARPNVEARNSTGGLAAVWATENTRDALFDALRRRETYATSGTRISLRFFAGDLGTDACARDDLLEHAIAEGVPMGGRWTGVPPTFVAWAARAPDATMGSGINLPGTPLHRLQIIKLWVDEDGPHEAVHDIGGTAARAEVDPDTCAVPTGHDELCSTWSDPDFDPSQHAAYYVRALEQPSCRWSTWVCRHRFTRGVDYRCAEDGLQPGEREPTGCCDTAVPLTEQQRAWSSPIYTGP